MFRESAVYLVYDTRKTPQQNRPPLTGSSDAYMVGFPIYPAENVAAHTYRSLIPPKSDSIHYDRSITWTSPTKVNLYDIFKGFNWLITVDLSHGAQSPVVSTRIVGKSDIY
jgi:hypothetical protein